MGESGKEGSKKPSKMMIVIARWHDPSKEQAKQDQTPCTASELSEPLPQVPPSLVVTLSSPTKT